MTQINLRDYLHGLEEMIDSGHAEDVLAHCRHILESYPKNIGTYRILGKAYLELKRHNEAEDIFKRVLSSVPDDFVSQIGMSIVREDEGNTDAAIWHMERAFEAQPSNRAVQDELRRLFGKRDGIEPPKVRLTRGALARMYAHGDLYNQAISELRSALSEDPQRPDLQVVLAEMYFKTNKQTEAIEVCSKLIEKLPYCLYANRAMAEIMRSNQREIEAKPYMERIEELDPYAAQANPAMSPEEVPADTVMLEHLEIAQKMAAPPKAWTASLQMPEESKFPKEQLPNWLSLENIEEKLPAEEAVKAEESSQESSMLEHLQSLEPVSSTEAEPEKHVTEAPFTSVSQSTALRADSIPEWLRELRPDTGAISSEATETPSAPDEIEKPVTKPATEPSYTPATTEDAVETPEAPVSQPKEDEENLDWLEKLASKPGSTEEELPAALESHAEHEATGLEEKLPQNGKSGTLAWLDELEKESETPTIPSLPVEPQAEPLLAKPSEELTAPETQPIVPTAKSETTPAWLKDLSAESQPSAESAEPIAPRELAEAPDWLSELRPESAPSEMPEEAKEEEWHGEGDLSKLDWLEEPSPAQEQPSEPEKAASAWIPETEMAPAAEKIPAEPAPAAPAISPRKAAQKMSAQDAAQKLEQARQALNYGKLMDAADRYSYLLTRRLVLDEVIADLSAAVHRHPQDATLWQTLGDAYARNNQLREALDSYNKARDLL